MVGWPPSLEVRPTTGAERGALMIRTHVAQMLRKALATMLANTVGGVS